jgi:hypothetical protein
MNKYSLLLFILTCALTSCQNDLGNDNYIIIQEEDFEVIPITSKKYFFEEIINPANIGIIDSKVLISERHRVPEEHPRIHIINSKDWAYDKPKGKHGVGPLEAIDASLFYKGKSDDTFWAYSMNGRKLLEYSMSETTLLGKSEWKMPEPMKGSLVFHTGI